MKKYRIIALIFALITALCLFSYTASAEITDRIVKVKTNGQILNSEYSAVLWRDTTIVPLRAVMESLECKVEWEDSTQTVIITNTDKEIKMQIGSDTITVNGEEKSIPVPAMLIGGNTTYVPLRAISESLGATVGWDGEDYSVGIYTRGKSTLTIGLYSVKVGSAVSELTSVCGQPSYTAIGDKGLVWYVYNIYPSAFMAVATDSGLVCGYYTNSPLFKTSDGISYGTVLPAGATAFKQTVCDGYTVSQYNDTIDGMVYAVYCMADGFGNDQNVNDTFAAQSKLGLDILNSFRISKELLPLEWDDAAEKYASDHSRYMSASGVLSLTSIDGSSAIEKYLTYNPDFEWNAWGANICSGATNVFNCMNEWVNSSYQRKILLADRKYMGMALVYNPDGIHQYTATALLLK